MKSLVFLFIPVLVVIVPLIVFGIYGWWRIRQLKNEMVCAHTYDSALAVTPENNTISCRLANVPK
jgi:hypothetical protein